MTADKKITIDESDLGWALGCSRMGASHQRRTIPNQDAVAIESDTLQGLPYLAMAVADGHGDKRHDLSQYGAALAVEAAIDEMRSFYQNFGLEGSSLLLKQSFKADFARRVGRRWREAVLKDAQSTPPRSADMPTMEVKSHSPLVGLPSEHNSVGEAPPLLAQYCGADSKENSGEEAGGQDELHAIPSSVSRCLTRYGTTLLVVLITSDAILLGQIGDGDILLLTDGNQIEVPFERSEALIANETYSLSMPDSHQFWQTAVRERAGGSMILMATDGLVNAMAESHLETFARSLLARIQEFGVEPVAALLPDWLDYFSEQGSGDDITLALAWLHPDLTSTTTSTPFIPEEITRSKNMTLQSKQQVQAELLGNLIVKQKLGEGGQGAVYLVEGAHGSYALKWYNREQATEEQRNAIRYLVQVGAPRGAAGKRFIWPLDLVTGIGTTQFGYLMRVIDTRRFAKLGEVWANRKPRPTFAALCEISYQVANSYRLLHLRGHCYRDISAGNLMFDPVTGDVLICDNDNVGINRQSTCQVLGTMEYMAPEIIRGEATPSTESDLHSLAVLLFQLWISHHPMHGTMEDQVRILDPLAKRKVYGEMPIFIFDPSNNNNRLPNEYATARTMWQLCPKSLREHFTRAFTIGLRRPAQRVTEGEWQRLFLQLKDGIVSCRGCRAENFWQPAMRALYCWNCRQPVSRPPALQLKHSGGTHFLLLALHTKLTGRHLNPHANETDATTIVGQVVQNPANPQIWGIRNLTSTPWYATFSNGTTKRVPPQRAVPISAGVKVNFGRTIGKIVV